MVMESVPTQEYRQIQESHLTPGSLLVELMDHQAMGISLNLLNRKSKDLVHMLEIPKPDQGHTHGLERKFKIAEVQQAQQDQDMGKFSLKYTVLSSPKNLLLHQEFLLLVIGSVLISVETK